MLKKANSDHHLAKNTPKREKKTNLGGGNDMDRGDLRDDRPEVEVEHEPKTQERPDFRGLRGGEGSTTSFACNRKKD